VVKIPRFAFEKFKGADRTLTTQMKSVGETMAIGRTFKESLQKALRGLETGRPGLGLDPRDPAEILAADESALTRTLRVPERAPRARAPRRLPRGLEHEDIYEATKIDPWFLENIRELVEFEQELGGAVLTRTCSSRRRSSATATGRSRSRRARPRRTSPRCETSSGSGRLQARRHLRGGVRGGDAVLLLELGGRGRAAPFEEAQIVILGGRSEPDRAGHRVRLLLRPRRVRRARDRPRGGHGELEPGDVSTDYDTSDDLFFEPLTHEDVMNIVRAIEPEGIIVQFGGQTPLNLATGLKKAGAPLIGTSVESIDRAEDRDLFNQCIKKLGLSQPESGMAANAGQAFEIARKIGYPVLVRPSYVLGGRAMEIVYDDETLDRYMETAVQVTPDRPILVDKFLEEAIEVDVDAISDGERVVIGGVMEHIEEAGIHSGDSTCVLPAHTLVPETLDEIRRATKALAKELRVIGLMNVQFAIKEDRVYVLEVNPRASRTVPFVSKAIGVPLAKLAAKVMCGMKLQELGFTEEILPPYFSVKVPVFPFSKFPGVDILLGPEMRSTGEVMGIDADLGLAFVKAYQAAGLKLPKTGRVFVSVKSSDKRAIIPEARTLAGLGYELFATDGTWRALKSHGIAVSRVNKVHEGRPHIVDMIKNREVDLVLNTPYGKQQRVDDSSIRAAAVNSGIGCITTRAGISAVVSALAAMHRGDYEVRSIQEHQSFRRPAAPAKPQTVA
jgi:carbamoyl-phosphate synthase large subunit